MYVCIYIYTQSASACQESRLAGRLPGARTLKLVSLLGWPQVVTGAPKTAHTAEPGGSEDVVTPLP